MDDFTQLNKTFGKKDITFPLSSISRVIEWRKNLNVFESGLSCIDTRTYHDFKIYKNNVWRLYFYKRK